MSRGFCGLFAIDNRYLYFTQLMIMLVINRDRLFDMGWDGFLLLMICFVPQFGTRTCCRRTEGRPADRCRQDGAETAAAAAADCDAVFLIVCRPIKDANLPPRPSSERTSSYDRSFTRQVARLALRQWLH